MEKTLMGGGKCGRMGKREERWLNINTIKKVRTNVTFAEASNEQLFQKMLECRQAIYLHCVNKLGEKIVKNMLKEFKC